mmetsp:Transcript_11605/g.23635  ORF Transcript_11605/g.23635 Transcript_11605/m.23635 type:complete len:218 (+) Transcript_11605:231-884(+)
MHCGRPSRRLNADVPVGLGALDSDEVLGEVDAHGLQPLGAAQLLVVEAAAQLGIDGGALTCVAQLLPVARVGLGARCLVLEVEKRELVLRLSCGERLLVARALLSRLQLECALCLLLLDRVRLEPQPRALGDRSVVHGLQLLARCIPSVDHLMQQEARLLHSRCQQRESGRLGEARGVQQEGLVRVGRTESHHIGAGGVDDLADGVIGRVEHALDVA